MAVTDPVDARLLAALAEVGKAAVHELAAKVGMDPREVAYRLVGLSASGLPLLVGVESDPNGLRAALAANPAQGTQSGPYPVHGTPSGPYPAQGMPSGPQQAHGTPSGPYRPPPGGMPPQRPYQPPPQRPPQPQAAPPPSQPQPAQPDPVISTWGPPQSASWARGDEQRAAPPKPAGRPGDTLKTQGLEGERLAIQLLEVQDPADYLFGAAGYRLEQGERAVVVHTEITNRGAVPFASLPDNYLELITGDGKAVTKAPVSLTSRPPHKIGVQPGETSGGHTVYVLPENTRIASVRWSPRPEPDERTLTWSLDD
ncbi:AsnC family protein [Qaidamihabitans albus]|uniref:AsnC family protein n=1 Tax=Qaidamihabitans albus TaxID=2795733 RepID=UPI0018F13322|nr:AsnC family protein [Qaidamihabitans albus]